MTSLSCGLLNEGFHKACHKVEEDILQAVRILLGLLRWIVIPAETLESIAIASDLNAAPASETTANVQASLSI